MAKINSCLLISFIFLFSQHQVFAQTSKKLLKTIVVDAGHGGKDAGAVGQYENSIGSKEKDVTLAISKKVVEELKKQLPDVNIVPTRTTDVYQDPREKANIANDVKGDLFLCIHADSGPLKTGRRQIGTRTVTRHKITYKGKGKHRKKISTHTRLPNRYMNIINCPLPAPAPVYGYLRQPKRVKN